MRATKLLFALFVGLTIVFGAVSVLEYAQLSVVRGSATSSEMATIPAALPVMYLEGTPFTYTDWNTSTPNAFAILGVRFAISPIAAPNYGGACYGEDQFGGNISITFPDGSSQDLTTCTVGPATPVVVRLTGHSDPQAGVLIVPSNSTVYFLVSGHAPS